MAEQKPKLLIIGANGFVGAWVARLAVTSFDVTLGSRSASGPNSVPIDITQTNSVIDAFEKVKPDVVLLTAAIADIDKCERERELIHQINCQGPVNVANECKRHGTRLIFCSTDAIFDGTLSAYKEDAFPTPVNEYGKSKARAEKAIADIHSGTVILRFSLVLGRSFAAGTNSYVDKLDAQLQAGQKVPTPTYEFRNPIDVRRLARVMIDLAARRETGIFHVAASDKLARYDLARKLAVKLGHSPDLIVPQTDPIPGRAPRGLDDFLVCERLPAVTGFVVPSCDEVIESAIDRTT
jgi:dTDP-4-dehydrorhamnose reductase